MPRIPSENQLARWFDTEAKAEFLRQSGAFGIVTSHITNLPHLRLPQAPLEHCDGLQYLPQPFIDKAVKSSYLVQYIERGQHGKVD